MVLSTSPKVGPFPLFFWGGGPISDRRCNGPNSNRDAAKSEALNEACRIDREVLRTSQSLDQASAIFDSRARVRRPLVFTSVNVQFCSVGRPGLDPGTLGLKGTFHRLFCVGLVAHVYCFQGIVLSPVGLVSWCCGNMRPKMRPVLRNDIVSSILVLV
jgi:hypothetical protein